MAIVDTSRRLQVRYILQDIESFEGAGTVPSYPTARPEATLEFLQAARQTMQDMQQKETELLTKAKAAADKARQAEWEFHNAVMAMKEAVRGHFGSDSDEAQAVGYKKKSEHKRPRRRAA
ncbi:hypothetical protein VB780_06535 [Leptolyngbya sp. CCNP1308]|uniref:hypothetical protein n=1 Tax=Leptolyngbya sp. CCNP1308 TaxID=3110255 RepID=UPI002B1F0CC6|nr:hypothetical protein [Leptolyngbya sp. CCNP1308]MEA5448219.1 hypothetical protein [Leptolyngbya sp. CCNP1308]